MSVDKVTRFGRSGEFVSARSLPYFHDNGLAHDLVSKLRWGDEQPYCPRCTSEFTKRVNTNIFRQLFRCIDCGYMFNSLSGTIFHGSKLPVFRYFHFFVLLNALRDELTIREVCFALDCSFKTASLWMKRADELRSFSQFAVVDKALSTRLSRGRYAQASKECESFFSYCEMKSIVVNEPELIEYIQHVARSRIGAED